MECTPELEKAVFNILDCFTGADGGGRFWNFKIMIEELERRSLNGDKIADKLVKIVTDFSRLIDVLNMG